MPISAFSQACVVVAHPDDEILWASSIARTVEEIICCYEDVPEKPGRGEARRRVLAEYPLSTVRSLGLTEVGTFNTTRWDQPEETEHGVAVGEREPAYRANYTSLVRLLSEQLRGRPVVVTHNPWGEYGHEDHVQVFRALARLQREMGFSLWVFGYVGKKSKRLMERQIGEAKAVTAVIPTDRTLAYQVRDLYIRHGCWTWSKDYKWPDGERFLLMAGDAGTVPVAKMAPREALISTHALPPMRKRAVNWVRRRIGGILFRVGYRNRGRW